MAGVLATSSAPSVWARSSAQGFVTQAESALADNHPGTAILNLERARLLSPDSTVVTGDLAQARRAANLPSDEPLVAGTAYQLLRTDQWGEVALAGLGLAAGALIALVWKPAGRRGFMIVAILGGGVATAGFLGAIRAEPPPNLAVVVSSNSVARVRPSLEAGVSFIPPEGSMVFIEQERGSFALISSRGRRGWVPSSSVETILPKS